MGTKEDLESGRGMLALFCPFKFTGKINKLTFDLGPAQYTEEDLKQLPAIADRVARSKD